MFLELMETTMYGRLFLETMPSILKRPVFHYGIPAIQAVIVAVVGFTVFSGIARLFALALAAIGVVVMPQVLKRAA